jgi:hypothetical protein
MTRLERTVTPSGSRCSVCDHELSLQELDEFLSLADEALASEVHCSSCRTEHLCVCPECSSRHTAGGLCSSCMAEEYGIAI